MNRTGLLDNKMILGNGQYIDLFRPDPEVITLPLIAKALSKLCRFHGQTPHFYSVAEHSCIALQLSIRYFFKGRSINKNEAKAILLHDAAEAFLGDLIKPIKIHYSDYIKLEDSFLRTIFNKYKLNLAHYRDVMRYYDQIALKLEYTTFWPLDKENWEGFDKIPIIQEEGLIRFYGPKVSEEVFLAEAEALEIEDK